jgi:ubiquinone/menaquinone biosynthesis C-methylase UbiE
MLNLSVIGQLKKKDSISDHAFRVKYLRRSRELYRRYLESKPWIKQLYSNMFNIKAGQRIVEIGCGTGDFTRYLAQLSHANARFLGIDSNPKSINAAVNDTKKARLSKMIAYKSGDVYNIPLENDYANITCCRTLLMHLTDPMKAVTEMTRVTRTGGSVIAVEGGKMASFYDPADEEHTRMVERAYDAWTNGIRKLEGKEFKIGEKLPYIFQKAGLTNIRAEIHADAWLNTDRRRKLNDIRADIRFNYSIFKDRRRRDRKYLLAGGLTNKWITSYFQLEEDVIRKQLDYSDEELRNDATVYGASFFLVSGIK